MSTKTTTDSSNKYDPQSMNRYQSWQNSMAPTLKSLFQNPFSSPFFNLNMQQQTKGASALAGRSMGNALLNFNRTGMGGSMGSGIGASLMNSLNRFGSGLQYQGFMNSVNQAQSDRWNAASLGQSMFGQPLQTGATQTQTKSGLGTWLPQVLAGAAAVAGAPFTGGASLMSLPGIIGGAGGGTASALSANPGIFGGGSGTPGTSSWTPLAPPTGQVFGTSNSFVPGGTGSINPWTLPGGQG